MELGVNITSSFQNVLYWKNFHPGGASKHRPKLFRDLDGLHQLVEEDPSPNPFRLRAQCRQTPDRRGSPLTEYVYLFSLLFSS